MRSAGWPVHYCLPADLKNDRSEKPVAMAGNAEVVLEMMDVDVTSIHTPELIVLEGVNWIVSRGEYWIVVGLPGSGKSDLLATAAGLLPPGKGMHRLFGHEPLRGGEEERVRTKLRVGVVFGYGGRLFNHLTVAENLALPFCYHHNCAPVASEKRVLEVIEAMELGPVAGSTPAVINRSLRQRAALARALVLSPELLVLDSPLAGVDPREERWWIDFLDALARGHPVLDNRPATLVVGTDDLEPWGGHACQYAVIQSRRFVPVGTRNELVSRRDQLLPELMPVDWLRE
jgi:ABC-type transporter Mla maintaining outer membrane lipid asymmetry ATPase subunit MlaF